MIKKLKMALNERFGRVLWADVRSQIERAATPGGGGIVMIGDSITHIGKWDLLFPSLPIRNFGIAGERSVHLLGRTAPVVTLRPEKIFILIGTNDLGVGVAPEEIAGNIAALVDRFRQELPDCKLHLQSVMPRQRRHARGVRDLNARLVEIATQRGIQYIDLVPALDDGSGQLKAEYTTDVLHLNGAGYMAWCEQLKPFLLTSTQAAVR